MIYKRCSRCGARIPSGTTCSCFARQQAERHRDYDRNRRNREAYDFYHSSEWRQTRERILERDEYIDVYEYMTTGQIIPADTVHHIIPLADAWDKRISPDNLISIHHDTHSKIEQAYKTDPLAAQKKIFDLLRGYHARLDRARG